MRHPHEPTVILAMWTVVHRSGACFLARDGVVKSVPVIFAQKPDAEKWIEDFAQVKSDWWVVCVRIGNIACQVESET